MRIRFASALAVVVGLACVTQTAMAATWKLYLVVSAPDSTTEQPGPTAVPVGANGQATGTAQIQVTVNGSTVFTGTMPVSAHWYMRSGMIYIDNWYCYPVINLPSGVKVGDSVAATVSVSTKVTPPSTRLNPHPQSICKTGQAIGGPILVSYGAYARYNLGMSITVPLP